MAGRRAHPDRVAAILAYALEHGDQKAAKKFKVADRTIRSYRQRRDREPALAATCQRAAEKVQTAWLEEAKSARSKVLARLVELALKSDNLRDVNGSLKIINDGVLAYEVVNPDGGRAGDGPGMAEPGAAPAGAEGNGDADRPVH